MWNKELKWYQGYNILWPVAGFFALFILVGWYMTPKVPDGFVNRRHYEAYTRQVELSKSAKTEGQRNFAKNYARSIKDELGAYFAPSDSERRAAQNRQAEREEQAAALVEAARIVQERGY